MKGVIYLCGYKDEGLLISRTDCKFAEDCEVRELIFENRESLIHRLIKKIKKVFVTSLLVKTQRRGVVLNVILPGNSYCSPLLLYNLKQEFKANSIKMVYLDEGIGCYIRSKKRWKERGSETCSPLQSFARRVIARLKDNLELDRIVTELKKNGCFEQFYLLKWNGESCVPNGVVCDAFRKVFVERSKMLDKRPDYSRVVLLNSQPFMEEIGYTDDIICYKKIREICESHGLKLVVKPHPREKRIDRYISAGIKLDDADKGLSQEILLASASVKPFMMIGFFSTSLILANLYYNIPIMCLSKLENFESIPGYGEDIANFMKTFSKLLIVPQTYMDVEKTIERMLTKYNNR